MAHTLGYHVVISGHGLWLPGDERGHWSAAWDENVGFVEPHTLHGGDPVRLRMAAERLLHPPVRLSFEMMAVITDTLARCAAQSEWRIAAASIEPTHTHLLLTYSTRDINNTVKWIKDQATKSIHRTTAHAGPVWCEGRWRSFIFTEPVWQTTQRYIERHNERRGQAAHPYAFICP